MRLCQVLDHVPVVYCKIQRHREAWKSNMKRHIWLIFSWLRMRQDFVHFPVLHCANFSDIGQQEWVISKGVSDLLVSQWDSVRLGFNFLLFTVQCKLLIHCAAKSSALKRQTRWINFWLRLSSIRSSFFYCANFLDIGQDKGVKWQDISDISNFEWDLWGICSISCCLLVNFIRHWATGRSNK